jgi:hypothetical protein
VVLSERPGRPRPALLIALLLGGCASAAPATRPAEGPTAPLRPTACEKGALMKGQLRDLADPNVVAADMMLGILAPESCPDASGRLDGGLQASER